MIKIGVADYGMNCWEGGLYDYEDRMEKLKKIGYDGIERLEAKFPGDVLSIAARVHQIGMDFATCRGVSPDTAIQWTAALNKNYVWTSASSFGVDFDMLCRQVNYQVEICKKWNIKAGLHNHLGSVVETQTQLLKFLEKCPECGLILDAGHLAAAEGGDPLYIINHYFDRLVAIHLKDYVEKNSEADNWQNRIRFCELGAGKMGDYNEKIVKQLKQLGYSGWVFVEHDTHLQDPLVDLAISRSYLKKCGI